MRRLYRDRPINAAITAGWGRQGIEVVTAQAMGALRRRIRALLERGTASSGWVVYLDAADNSIDPKTRYNAPMTPSGKGAMP
jgi:hypothetical protein